MSTLPSSPPSADRLTVFAGFRRIAAGPRADVVAQLRSAPPPQEPLLRVFDDATGERLDLDLRPEAAEDAAPARGVGRPRLGVVAREVTLLPRHWDWLARQPGGASVALRRIVDEARRLHEGPDTLRTARESTYRFMSEIAGDLPGFEEATRALFAGEQQGFLERIAAWPDDVRTHLDQLSKAAWEKTQ